MGSRLLALALLILLASAGWAEEAASIPEEEILVLQVELAGNLLADDLVAFDSPEGVLLPLHRLAELLELPLETEPAGGRTADGDLFVDARLLSSRLPVDVSVHRSELMLEIIPREKLPLQERWEREARRRDLEARPPEDGAPRQTRFALEEHPYELAGWPTVDGSVGFSLGLGPGGRSAAVRPAFLARGDLLAATAGLFVAEGEARLTLERRDSGGHLLGPLGATEWTIGDLAVSTDPLVSRGRRGRGLLIARAPEAALAGRSERTVLAGDALPGWEVELYRDGALLDVQRAGDDGRYELRDIPLRKGWNRFRLAFYGPHGERSEREERIYSSTDLLPAGATSWQLGILETGAGLLQPESRTVPSGAILPGSLLGSFDVERGLSRSLSWGAGLASLAFHDGRHDYLQLSLRASLPGGAGQIRATRDLRGGWAGQVRAQGELGPVLYDVDQVEIRDFHGDGEENREVHSRTQVRLSTQAPLPGRLFRGTDFPISLTATRQVTDRDEILTFQAASAVSLSLESSVLGNRWRLDAGDGALSAGGSLLWNGWLRNVGWRGNLSYELAPVPVLSDLSLQGETVERRGLAAHFGLSQNLQRSLTSASASMTWKRDPCLLGLTVGLTSRGRVELGGSLSFSLGHDPQNDRFRVRGEAGASQGTVSARVFLDADGDGRFGAGDSPLPGVALEADGGILPALTGDDGLAWVRVPSNRPVDLSVAETTLTDPAWVPGKSGIALTPRPGAVWAVDFPVVVTGEIEGTVFLRQDEGRRAVSNVRVQLVDEQGAMVQEVRSQFDGFYLFERVRPGRYSIQVEPGQLERLQLESRIEAAKIELRSGEILRGIEIVLLKNPPAV